MKGLYKGLHKSTENYSNFFTKVNFFSIFNFPIRRHVIFSRMNIIFFNDTEDVILQCILSGEDHLCFFWQKGSIIFLEKRNTIFIEYAENTISPCTF